jgi:hypothetical protein
MIQGTIGMIQRTFELRHLGCNTTTGMTRRGLPCRMIPWCTCYRTLGVIQATLGMIQETLGVIQGTFQLRPLGCALTTATTKRGWPCWTTPCACCDLGNIGRDSGNIRHDSGNIGRDLGNIGCATTMGRTTWTVRGLLHLSIGNEKSGGIVRDAIVQNDAMRNQPSYGKILACFGSDVYSSFIQTCNNLIIITNLHCTAYALNHIHTAYSVIYTQSYTHRVLASSYICSIISKRAHTHSTRTITMKAESSVSITSGRHALDCASASSRTK